MLRARQVLYVGTMVTILLLLFENGFSQTSPLTAREFVENSDLKAHVAELNNGEIVLMTQPEHEIGSQLNVVMAVLIPALLEKTVDTLRRQATAEEGPGILAIGEIKTSPAPDLEKAFAAVEFSAEEIKEVEKMMAVGPGDDFNFSLDEIAMINTRADEVQDGGEARVAATNAMSGAMRVVLKGRFLAYHERGLEGIAPYQVSSSKQINPSEELISATESLRLVKERFPDYYSCLRFYPQQQPAKLVHQFFWAKQMESGRPLFMLKHWVLDVRPDYALITERRFYLSHSLSSLQIVIGCLPHRNSTLVVLLNQVFTEKVNMTIGKSIAKAIGYYEVEKNIRPMFVNLQRAVSR